MFQVRNRSTSRVLLSGALFVTQQQLAGTLCFGVYLVFVTSFSCVARFYRNSGRVLLCVICVGLVLILVCVYVIFEWVIELVFGCVDLGRGARLAKLWKRWLRYI